MARLDGRRPAVRIRSLRPVLVLTCLLLSCGAPYSGSRAASGPQTSTPPAPSPATTARSASVQSVNISGTLSGPVSARVGDLVEYDLSYTCSAATSVVLVWSPSALATIASTRQDAVTASLLGSQSGLARWTLQPGSGQLSLTLQLTGAGSLTVYAGEPGTQMNSPGQTLSTAVQT